MTIVYSICKLWYTFFTLCHSALYLFVSEAEESNETPSSEEDQDLVDLNSDLSIKQSIPSSRKTISQIIKDKKKQTQLTLQW